MNVIKVKVNFSQRTSVKQGVDLTEGDYNSTKMVFDFDTDEGTKIFQMKNPSDEIVLEKEIINNEVILTGKADITTTHNEKTYVKYLDDSSNVYWYNSEDEELYDSTWTLDTTTSLDTLTKQTEDASIFTETGSYVYEISLYDGDSKLTSASDKIKVKKKQIGDDSEAAVIYKPVFDELVSEFAEAIDEVDNLDIDASKSGDTATITITDKTGTQKSVQITDGEKGDDGYSPTATVSKSGSTSTITITDKNGTTIASVTDGVDGEDGSDYVITQADYQSIANVVESDIAPTISSIQDTANTANNTANTAKSIAEGANQAIGYSNYQTMITAFNSLDKTTYRMGQNIYIVTVEVPDLWVSSVENTSSTYTYVDDATFITTLETNGYVQVGYYKLSMLETQKVDLTNYVTNTDYANSSTGGVVKSSANYGSQVSSSGIFYGSTRTYSQYNDGNSNVLICKGTLENVITGKGLVSNTDYATSSTGGVLKISNGDYGMVVDSGVLKGAVRTASQYSSMSSKGLVCKGTLENVLTNKGLNPIVTLTQAEYDALISGGTVDADTYYYVEE